MPGADRVVSYYAGFDVRELTRLDVAGDGAIEFYITTDRLTRYLPPAGRVLDAGGGPGRYTVWLADRGYRTTLLDVSPNLVELARARVAASAVRDFVEALLVGDARDLSQFPDSSFDAALCLGPMYHLQAEQDRKAVARELHRVLAPGAPAFVAWMPRLLFLRRSVVVPEERGHLLDDEFVKAVVEEGRFDNDVPGRFDHGYGARPDEIEPFMAEAGFVTIELLAAESFAAGGIGDHVADLAEQRPEVLPRLLALLSQHASDRGLLADANHLLWIGRKRG